MIKGYFVRTPLFVARNPKNSNPASVILGWKLFLGGGKSILRFFSIFGIFSKIYNRSQDWQKLPPTANVNGGRDLPPPETAVGRLTAI
jgi:hypothetical protein